MNIRALSARGVIGLSKFDGTFSFDAASLPEGLVSITGPNGHGKSTFLELAIAGLYKRFPSRPDNSLFDSCDGKDAFLEVAVDVEGRGMYRARVNVDAVSRATEAVLERTGLDGATIRLNDGKVSTFEAAVARELPTLDVLLASAFAAQNKQGAFSELGKKDRKELFARFLGFETLQRMADTASQAAGLVDKRLVARRSVLERLQADTTPAHEEELGATGNALQADLMAAEHAHNTATAELVVHEHEIETRRRDAASYQAAAAELVTARQRLADRTSEVAQNAADRQQLDRDEARDLDSLRAASARAVAGHRAAIDALETPAALAQQRDGAMRTIQARVTADVEALQVKIRNNRSYLLERETEIRSAVEQVAALTATLADRERARTDATIAQQSADATERALALTLRNAGDPASALARAQADAALIERVPFGAKCVDAQCSFVAQAAAAAARIPALEADVAARAALVADLEAAQRAVESTKAELGRVSQQVTDTRAELDTLQKTAHLLPQLEAAHDRIKELEEQQRALQARADEDRAAARTAHDQAVLRVGQQRAAAEQAIVDEGAQLETALANATATWADKRADVVRRGQAIARAIDELRAQIAQLEATIAQHGSAHDALVACEARIAAAREDLSTADRRLAAITEQIKAFEARRERFMQLLAERAQHETAVRQLETDKLEWQALAKVLGRDGLQVLEIANAGPAVSDLANDLLRACYGGRFQIELRTQEPKADGKGFKEVFDVVVTDAEKGTEPDLSDLSGGERVVVDEALRSAIALYINTQNTFPIRTCWRDETLGALDPDAAVRYVAMLRRIQERGRFTRLYFISHNLDAAALADAQIVIKDGALTVQYPPFSEAA